MAEARAAQLKEEGNRHFQKGDYINAEGCYSKGFVMASRSDRRPRS
ncbi:hypothetical protein VDGD_21385 [Verticillium dahliae]|nr:hypothetical protein VDGD_21385 [Verticillium dahliae]